MHLSSRKKIFLKGAFVLTRVGLISRVIGFFFRIFLSRSFGTEGNLPSDLSRLRTLYFFVCRRDRDCTLPSDRPVCFPWKARSFQGILSDRPVSFYCIIFALHGLHPDFCTGHCRVPLE